MLVTTASTKGSKILHVNWVGIVAAITAFISSLVPWWTMTVAHRWLDSGFRGDLFIYLYIVEFVSLLEGVEQPTMSLLYCWIAFAIILSAGSLILIGSMIAKKSGKTVIIVAAALILLSVVIFGAGLSIELSQVTPSPDLPKVGFLSSGSFTFMGMPYFNYSTYPTFGFWVALVSAILAFASSIVHPILWKCLLCGNEVVRFSECLSCDLRTCMACAVDNHGKCPKCNRDLVRRK